MPGRRVLHQAGKVAYKGDGRQVDRCGALAFADRTGRCTLHPATAQLCAQRRQLRQQMLAECLTAVPANRGVAQRQVRQEQLGLENPRCRQTGPLTPSSRCQTMSHTASRTSPIGMRNPNQMPAAKPPGVSSNTHSAHGGGGRARGDHDHRWRHRKRTQRARRPA